MISSLKMSLFEDSSINHQPFPYACYFSSEVFLYIFYYMVLALAAFHNMDKMSFCYTCKLYIFYNIFDQESNCLCQILFSLSVSFHIYFCKPFRGTCLGVKDVIKSNESPRGEDEGLVRTTVYFHLLFNLLFDKIL